MYAHHYMHCHIYTSPCHLYHSITYTSPGNDFFWGIIALLTPNSHVLRQPVSSLKLVHLPVVSICTQYHFPYSLSLVRIFRNFFVAVFPISVHSVILSFFVCVSCWEPQVGLGTSFWLTLPDAYFARCSTRLSNKHIILMTCKLFLYFKAECKVSWCRR